MANVRTALCIVSLLSALSGATVLPAAAGEPVTLAAIAEAADRRDAASPVWSVLADPAAEPAVVAAAARGLGRIGGDDPLARLLPLLGHGDAGVRRETAFAIGILNLQAPERLAEAEQALKTRLVLEPDPLSRHAVLLALGQTGGPATQALLRDYPLDRVDAAERADWAQATGLLWSYRRSALAEVDAALVRQLIAHTTKPEPVAEMAAFALARARKEAAVQDAADPLLRAFAASPSDGARIFLLRALQMTVQEKNERDWLRRAQQMTVQGRKLNPAERIELLQVLASRLSPKHLRELVSLALRSPASAERIAVLQALQGRPVETEALRDLLLAHQALQPGDAALLTSLLQPPTGESDSEEGSEPLAATPAYAVASRAVGRRYRLQTLRGAIDIELLPDAVYTAANFAQLADAGYYNGTVFHRVIGNFVAQGGDPTGTGEGGPGWRIREELSRLPHAPGYIGMATAGKDTAGSQFFINTGRNPHLDWHYTVFAKVIAGMPQALALRQGDVLIAVQPLP